MNASDGRRRRDFGTADLFADRPSEEETGAPAGGVLDGVRGAGGRPEPPAVRKPRVVPPPPKACVARFIEECCEADREAETSAAIFREAYRTWALANGLPVMLGMTLGKFFASLGVRKRKSGGVSVYYGVRLKDALAATNPPLGDE